LKKPCFVTTALKTRAFRTLAWHLRRGGYS
jgi:hypothetical protein